MINLFEKGSIPTKREQTVYSERLVVVFHFLLLLGRAVHPAKLSILESETTMPYLT